MSLGITRRERQTLPMLQKLDILGREGDLFGRLLDDLFHFHGMSPIKSISGSDFSPSLDLTEKEKEYIVAVEVPGIEKEDIHIDVDDNTLIISGEKKQEKVTNGEQRYVCERSYGAFRREFSLPADSTVDNVSAKYANGVLTINIPKKETEEKEKKKISIA